MNYEVGNDITATLPLCQFFPCRLLALFNPLTPKREAVHKLTGTFSYHPTSSYITDELTIVITIKKPSSCSWNSLV